LRRRRTRGKKNPKDAFSFELSLARASSLSSLRHFEQAAETYLVISPSREIAAVAPAREDTASLSIVASFLSEAVAIASNGNGFFFFLLAFSP